MSHRRAGSPVLSEGLCAALDSAPPVEPPAQTSSTDGAQIPWSIPVSGTLQDRVRGLEAGSPGPQDLRTSKDRPAICRAPQPQALEDQPKRRRLLQHQAPKGRPEQATDDATLTASGQLTRAAVYWYKLPHVPVLDRCRCGPSMRGWVRPAAINGRPLGGGNSLPTLLSWKGPVLDGS